MKRILFASFAISLTAMCGFCRQPERGYRGFADWTNRIYHHNDQYWSKTYYAPGISTSHGYQFNPWLFAGVGLDYSLKDIGYSDNHYYQLTSHFLSIFADVRTDLQFSKFTPFGDVRIGVNATSHGTFYFSPTIGYRFNWERKIGINVGVGYTLDSYRYERHVEGTTPDGFSILVPTGQHFNYNKSSFTFRVGIDF